jgi:ribonuclease P protein component
MLPKKNRLKLFKDFKNIFKKGIGLKENGFYIKFVNNNLLETRISVVVSKKQHKKATQRNRIRRQVREVLRKNFSQIKEGKDIVVIVSGDLKKESFDNLQNKIITIFKKLKLIKNKHYVKNFYNIFLSATF